MAMSYTDGDISEKKWRDMCSKMVLQLRELLMSADCEWENKKQGHDWAEACESTRELLAAYNAMKDGQPTESKAVSKPSPLDIVINEGLFFVPCNRSTVNIMFYINGNDYVIIHDDGTMHATGWIAVKQLNEIIRVRAALGWTGK